jgi:hypothetical protein
VPQLIISVSMTHMLFIISMLVPSAGISVHFIPLSDIAQLIWHIIGIIVATGAPPIIDVGPGIEVIDIGIMVAGFMVTSWLDNEL